MLQQITIKSLILKTIMDYAATSFDVNLSTSDHKLYIILNTTQRQLIQIIFHF